MIQCLVPKASVWQRLRKVFGRKVTLLLIPHASWGPWRAQCSMSFLAFGLVSWSCLTLWAGYLVGRNFDYWITKADNQVLRMKMVYFTSEFDRTRELLSAARDTDLQMRTLLGMRSRRAIIESEQVLGGPNPRERRDFDQVLAQGSDGLSQPEFRRAAKDIQGESKRRLASFQEVAWYIASQRNLYRALPNLWPSNGRLTSSFGYRFSPFNAEENGEFHAGVDIANSPETPIVAAADGVVRFAGWQSGYGNVVLLDHGYGFSTLYGHASRLRVRPRQSIRRGQVIASMGTTGRSTREHIHYEVWRNGKPVNPRIYLKRHPAASMDIPVEGAVFE